MTANRDLDNDGVIDEDEEEIEERRSNPLRMIILILLALVGLCVICFLGSQLFGTNLLGSLPIPGLPSDPLVETPAPLDTPTLASTDAASTAGATTDPGLVETALPPPIGTSEFTPTPIVIGTQEPLPATGEASPPATQVPEITMEPTEDLVGEHSHELPTDEPTATTQPVPGPTATATVGSAPSATPQTDCSANTPPTADAGDPTTGMMGKGQAVVTFDGSGSSDADGTISSYEWDFGDGETGSGRTVSHGYRSTGTFEVTLTVTDNCGATAEDTVQVTITGPTPPAPVTGTPTVTTTATTQPTVAPTGQPTAGTMGFCYRVRPGNTLTGIAGYYGVPVPVLAEVNGVSPDYFVIAGQGIFVPQGNVRPGPNIYTVQPGDTLNSIAFQCGLSIATLANANGLTPGQSLTPGQHLGIPLWSWY